MTRPCPDSCLMPNVNIDQRRRSPRHSLSLSASFVLMSALATLAPNLAFASDPIRFQPDQRIALVGNSTAERMNLFGHFETRLHLRTRSAPVTVRNFGWPADEVGNQQRPSNYTEIDDPMEVYGPDLFLCFFGFNESFAGDSEEAIARFVEDYRAYIRSQTEAYTRDGKPPRFVLVTPIAFESTGNPLQPDGAEENRRLAKYAEAVIELGAADGHRVVDLFTPSSQWFGEEPGAQYTINGIHLNERGDEAVARALDRSLFGDEPLSTETDLSAESDRFERIREAVNDKSWLHLQDYRMLNGWYVYGGRRTWDTETFPTEFRKIRQMVEVRDEYIWDLAAGRPVPPEPDDSETGEVFIPETMFGSRDENFRRFREPETLEYPTPEESIRQMNVPDGFEVELFASEREFPELANPTQIAFDDRGRLWVSCMVNYPQWLPGGAKPNDRLLILEDTTGDGKADKCTTFYDELICPTGFEFHEDGVLVVDEPRILFLKDNDGDDQADEVVQILDGIGTDDTHHAMGAWEYSHGGLLHMLEGIAMSTTLETPWGPFRNRGPSGSYVWDLDSLRVRHFRTPAYGNPWCLVFDQWGNGIIGDGTGAQHHWASLLSGGEVRSRRSVQPIFDNEGMRPAVGNDFLTSRHFPPEVQGQFIYGCVINLHGFPRFTIEDETGTAGFTGERIENFLESTDMFFRPVDPKIGPDGALWFGDWCNALIGHMQYSQRDPNRDHEHGRIYRMVHRETPLLDPATQAGEPVEALLHQLEAYEPRTRYRARRALWGREREQVLSAADRWLADKREASSPVDPQTLCEALWLQEAFHAVDPELVAEILENENFHARAAATHVVSNQWRWIDDPIAILQKTAVDEHPRVRLETLRGASFLSEWDAVEIVAEVARQPRDQWIDYVLDHTLQALEPVWSPVLDDVERQATLAADTRRLLMDYRYASGPAAEIYKPLRTLLDSEDAKEQREALGRLVAAGGGDEKSGIKVFERACGACHRHGELGKKFGPELTDVSARLSREQLIRSIVWPNEEISKGYETVMVLTYDGQPFNGFVLSEDDDEITLGVANGKQVTIDKAEIELRQPIKASSMPEGLLETIAPGEFLDLLEFLSDGWITTDPNPGLELRRHGEFVEVSRDTRIRLGDNFPTKWNVEANRFLSGKRPEKHDFAFHSPNRAAEDPHVVIRFDTPVEIRHATLTNRRSEQYHDRAKGLAMWISDDGKSWERVWTSPGPQAKWSIDLPEGTTAAFVKLGLTEPGILHLDQGVFYGTRLEPDEG